MFDPVALSQFEQLQAQGMAAKDAGQHETALALFTQADQLAESSGEEARRLDALQPAARALWTLGRYDEAESRLATAESIAEQHSLDDERGIIVSNLGRLAATRVVRQTPVEDQPARLAQESLGYFDAALGRLAMSTHYYYRYANAQHGSVVAALAGDRSLAGRLLLDGAAVAFRRSPAPYNEAAPIRTHPKGIVQFIAAAALLPLGNRTPLLANYARQKLVR